MLAHAVAWLRTLVGATLEIAPGRIDPEQTLERYGIDSITVLQVTNKLREAFDDVPSSLLFEHNTIDALARHLADCHGAQLKQVLGMAEGGDVPVAEPVATDSVPATVPVLAPVPVAAANEFAIIGVSGRYPQGESIDAFWDLLRSGRSGISEVPPARWNWRDFAASEGTSKAPISSRFGGFLNDIDRFDPLFFQIAMAEAENMDPQERLFIEQAYGCIEDAGYVPADLSAGKRVGVFVGVMNANYPTGTRHWSIANRISYLFDFHGPSMAVDTACSSSLTAIHLALEALQSGGIDCALAGGVNLIVDPVHMQRLSAMNMLSKGAEVRAFGAGADGFVDGEGVGAILIKPLSRALADGDAIHAILLGSAVNAGGRTHGYTVPSPLAQADVLRQACSRAGIAARDITCVEAHGTGTALGDPIEVRGLTLAFEDDGSRPEPCALGSVKSNIGHTESAAGIAGLTKVLLQMKHRMLVPSLSAAAGNPEINWARTPFRVQQALAAWEPGYDAQGEARPRIATVSSFGAGGANAAVVLREHVPTPMPTLTPGPVANRPELVILSARTPGQLNQRIAQLAHFVAQGHTGSDTLGRIAHTLQVGRTAMDQRCAMVVSSVDELVEILALAARGTAAPGLYRGAVRRNDMPAPAAAPDAGMTPEQCWRDDRLDVLARFWTSGEHVQWAALKRPVQPRRLHLPTYPFADQRYWIGAAPATTGAGPGSASAPVAAPAAAEAPVALSALVPVWRAVAAAVVPLPPARSVVLAGVGLEGLQQMRRQVPHACLVALDTDAGVEQIAMDLCAAGELEQLVWLAPDCAGPHGAAAAPAQQERVLGLFRFFKALLALGYGTRTLMLTIVTTQAVAIDDDDSLVPDDAGLHGLAGSTAQEYPNWHLRVLDQTLDAPLSWNELTCADAGVAGHVLARRRGQWFRRELAEAVLPAAPASVYRHGGCYVVAGGAGGIGAAWSAAMIRQYRARIVWLGRRAPDDGIRAALAGASDGDLAPEYVQVDATDPVALAEACRAIKARHPVIAGVVHSALVLADQRLADMTEARFLLGMRAKSAIAEGLAREFAGAPLDFMLFFSSIIVFGGAAGQSNYAAGSTFQDAFSSQLARTSSWRVHTVNWGYWGSVGAVATADHRRRMAERGIGSIEPAAGLAALARCLGSGLHQVALVQAAQPAPPDETPSLIGLLDDATPVAVRPEVVHVAPVARHRPDLWLRQLAGSRVGVGADLLDGDIPLVDYGFDAAAFTWLAQALNQRTAGPAPVLTGEQCAVAGTLQAIDALQGAAAGFAGAQPVSLC